MDADSTPNIQTTSLIDLFATPLVSDNLLPNLSLSAISRLSQVSHSFRDFIFKTPGVFRHLDLSRCKGAYIPALPPIDAGGHSWRAERMDENLTEDEFYAGPLRGVLSKLRRQKVLHDVQILVLDGLASVTNDLLHDIVTSNEYNVRLLSIRKCINVNQVKLQQLLRYICRPERPENTPRLQGLYFFTNPTKDRNGTSSASALTGITLSDGAALGMLPVDKSQPLSLDRNSWYEPAGKLTDEGYDRRSSWEETLQACKGIIAFDAVLCQHMHSAMSACLSEYSLEFLEKNKPGIPPIATVALGSDGCTGCGRAPEGTPVWGESDMYEFPLLSPPPRSGRLIDAIRPPTRRMPDQFIPHKSHLEPQLLIVSCSWCLVNRHCDSCHRWWCADCYDPKKSNGGQGESIKVLPEQRLCVQHCLVGEMMTYAGSYGMWA